MGDLILKRWQLLNRPNESSCPSRSSWSLARLEWSPAYGPSRRNPPRWCPLSLSRSLVIESFLHAWKPSSSRVHSDGSSTSPPNCATSAGLQLPVIYSCVRLASWSSSLRPGTCNVLLYLLLPTYPLLRLVSVSGTMLFVEQRVSRSSAATLHQVILELLRCCCGSSAECGTLRAGLFDFFRLVQLGRNLPEVSHALLLGEECHGKRVRFSSYRLSVLTTEGGSTDMSSCFISKLNHKLQIMRSADKLYFENIAKPNKLN